MSLSQLSSEDVRTDLSTRQVNVKWVIVVDKSLPAGRAANAAACMAVAVGKAMPALVGPEAVDGSGGAHAGLPWAGCSVLAADTPTLRALRHKAGGRKGVFVVDMPDLAQRVKVYDEYLDRLAAIPQEAMDYHAVSLVGPRNAVDKLVGGLPLLR